MVKRKKRRSSPRKKVPEKDRWHAAPLKGSFMLTAILGVLVSIYFVYPQSKNYGIAFILVFIVMFFASIVSMTKAPLPEY